MMEPITKMPFDFEEIKTAMTYHSELSEAYLNTKSGEILYHNLDSDDNEAGEKYIENMSDEWVPIPPIESHESYRWMEQFVDSLEDEDLAEKLSIALNGKEAFRRFKDVLACYPVARDNWYQFEAKKIDGEVNAWLEVTASQVLLEKNKTGK